MSDSPLPDYVDARKIFAQRGSVKGLLSLERLSRLLGSLARPEGEVSVFLDFQVDDSGRKIIAGQVVAKLSVACQRCLEPLTITIDEQINLLLVADEAGAKKADPEFDPWIAGEQKIDLAELVEEQLLLSLPIVSFHGDGPCSDRVRFSTEAGRDSGTSSKDELSAESPFKVLEALKKS